MNICELVKSQKSGESLAAHPLCPGSARLFTKSSLFDGLNIGKFLPCVNQKMITRCGLAEFPGRADAQAVVLGIKLLEVLMRDYKRRIRRKRYA